MNTPTPDALRVYVGHALTGAPKSFTDQVTAFKADLAKTPELCEMLDFLTCETAGCTADEATDWCLRECVPRCDLMVAVVDERSTTLGVEMALALAIGRPVIALAQKGSTVSRVVKRLQRVWPHFTFAECNDIRTDGLKIVRERVLTMRASAPGHLWSADSIVQRAAA